MEKKSISKIEERERLRGFAHSRSAPYKVVVRSKIILMADEGETKSFIAKELNISRPTVILWIRRYKVSGIEGIIKDKPRGGCKKKITSLQIKDLVDATLSTKPRVSTHWSVRTMAKEKGLSRMTVWRVWKAHRIENFKFSNDPNFVEKLL